MQLYKMTDEIKEAIENMGAMLANGEIDEDARNDTLEGLMIGIEDKVINVGLFIKNQEAEAAAIRAAISEFNGRLKSIESTIDFYKNYLFKHMQANHIETAGNEYIALKVKKLPDMVQVGYPALLSADLFLPAKPVPERQPDKKAILAAFKKDGFVDGAELITDRKALSIK